MSSRQLHDQWKLDRIIELGSRTGVHTVYVDQIAARLGMLDTYVIRHLRKNGIEPPFRPKFSYRNWLSARYAADREAGKVTGRRPASYRAMG